MPCTSQSLPTARTHAWQKRLQGRCSVYLDGPDLALLETHVPVLIIQTSEGLRGMGIANYKPPGPQPDSRSGSSEF